MFIGNYETYSFDKRKNMAVTFGRGPDKKPRKRRADSGEKRTLGETASSVASTAGNAAKYAAGLRVGSEIWNAGNKAGKVGVVKARRLANKTKIGRRLNKTMRKSRLGKGAAVMGGLVAADQAVKAVGRATAAHKIRKENRRKDRE